MGFAENLTKIFSGHSETQIKIYFLSQKKLGCGMQKMKNPDANNAASSDGESGDSRVRIAQAESTSFPKAPPESETKCTSKVGKVDVCWCLWHQEILYSMVVTVKI